MHYPTRTRLRSCIGDGLRGVHQVRRDSPRNRNLVRQYSQSDFQPENHCRSFQQDREWGSHSDLSGGMEWYASPADPIFWSHHSMVDALHSIFHKCRVGTQRRTFEEKTADPVTVRTGSDSNPANASQDSVVDQFFHGVPNRYADLMDVRDLGDFSYSYELSGQLASMYNGCDGTSTLTTSALTPTIAPEPATNSPVSTPGTPEATSTNAPKSTTAAPAPTRTSPPATISPSVPPQTMTPSSDVPMNIRQLQDARQFFQWLWNNIFPKQHAKIRKLEAEEEMGNANISTQQQSNVATPNPSKGVYDDGKVGVSIIGECGKSGQRVMTWYQQTATAMGGMTAETIADIERQSCMSHDECLGGVKDFSDEFKARWGVQGIALQNHH